jgi:hypothetical protein
MVDYHAIKADLGRVVILEHFEVVLVLLDKDESGLLLGDDDKEDADEQSEDKVDEGEISLLGEVLEEDEGEVEDVVGEVEGEQEVEGEGHLPYLAVGGLHIEQFLDALLVYYHLRDVLILVLHCQIQRQLTTVILYVAVASPHQQLLHNPPIPRHHC